MSSQKIASILASVFALSACVALASSGCANTDPLGSGGAGGELTAVGSTTHVSSSSKASSSSTVASTSVASSTSASSSTASTGSGGPMCTDTGPGEPNNSMALAFSLPAISDCDSDAAVVKGVLDQTKNDVDWYKYAGSDTSTCSVDPTRQLIGAGIRICKYVECSNGKTPSFSCPSGSTDDTQNGKPGCCATNGAPFTLNLTCGSTFLGSDDATIYIRVDHVGGPGCENYQVNYHF